MTAALCGVFFVSGVAGLLFETLWFSQAGLVLGNSIWASSLVLAAFMGGLAVGNGWAGRFGERLRDPLGAYALLEVIVGVVGLALVYGLPALTPALAPILRPLGEAPWALNFLRVGLAFVLLVAPAAAMGATLPVLVRALHEHDGRFGAVLGTLYGWNTLGAVGGALVGELWLVSWLGIRGTGIAAALLNGLAAVGALALRRRRRGGTVGVPPRAPPPRSIGPPLPARRLLIAAFAAGAALLGLEVVWFRLLLLSVTGTNLAFGVMLAVVLAGIGLGGLLGGRLLAVRPELHRRLPELALASGIAVASSYWLHAWLPRSFDTRSALTGLEIAERALPLMLPTALLSGVVFTWIGEALHASSSGAARSAGALTVANTLGGAIGSLAVGFVLLPIVGAEASLVLLAAGYGVVAAATFAGRDAAGRRLHGVTLIACAVAFAVALAWLPRGLMESRLLAQPIGRFAQWEPALVREGLTETLVYLRRELFGEPYAWRLLTNSHSMSSTSTRDRRYMTLFVYWPLALRPEPESALLISYGVGVTARALVDVPSLREIDVVDVSREILASNRIIWREPGDYPLDDPRVRVHVEDGRHFLETSDRRFDLVTGEPPPPKLAGIVSLYTREYFALVHARLAEGGVATYWLPVGGLFEEEADAIIAGFCDVFDDCSLWTGAGLDWMLVGSRGGLERVSPEAFARPWSEPRVAPRMRALGFERPADLGTLFLADARMLRERTRAVAPLVDDRPKRLSDVVPQRGMDDRARFRAFMDAGRARERFAESRFIAEHWPVALREETLAAFEWRAWIDRWVFQELQDETDSPVETLPALHRVLTETDLETLPLWLLGSDVAAVEAARRAADSGRAGLGIDYQLAAAAMARRDYASAAALFGRARALPLGAERRELVYQEIHALALAGKSQEAAALVERAALARGRRDDDRRFFRFYRDHLQKRAGTARVKGASGRLGEP